MHSIYIYLTVPANIYTCSLGSSFRNYHFLCYELLTYLLLLMVAGMMRSYYQPKGLQCLCHPVHAMRHAFELNGILKIRKMKKCVLFHPLMVVLITGTHLLQYSWL